MSTAPGGGAPSRKHTSMSNKTVAAVISALVNIIAVATTRTRFSGGDIRAATCPAA